MPKSHSRRFISRIVLLISSALLLLLVAWVGYRIFQPVSIPADFSSQVPVSFNADEGIVKNTLLQRLRSYGINTQYVVGSIGNPYPLGGDPKKINAPKGYDNETVLATAKELNLHGMLAKDIALHTDGGVIALLYQVAEDGRIHYEIHAIDLVEDTVVAQWDALSTSDLRVASMIEDLTGRIWLLNERGQVGRILSDGAPTWLVDFPTGLMADDPSRLVIASDTLDRIWISDGVVVSVGGEKGFSPIGLMSELTEDQREQYDTLLVSQAEQIGLRAELGSEALLRSALAPKGFFPLQDGRMGLVLAHGVMIFPQSQASRSEWIPTLQSSLIPYGVSTNGDIWGVRYTDKVLLKISDGKEVAFDTVPAPKTEVLKASMMAFSESGNFVFQKTEKGSNLWYSAGDTWSMKIVVTSGTQAIVAPTAKVQAESSGTVWTLMEDGFVYRVTPGAEVDPSAQKAIVL
jgi:hypothetical protein